MWHLYVALSYVKNGAHLVFKVNMIPFNLNISAVLGAVNLVTWKEILKEFLLFLVFATRSMVKTQSSTQRTLEQELD